MCHKWSQKAETKVLYSRFHRPTGSCSNVSNSTSPVVYICLRSYISIFWSSKTKMLGCKPKIVVLGQKLWSIANSGGLRWWGDMRGESRASGQHMRWKGIPGNLVTHFFLVFSFNVVFGHQRSWDTWLPSRNGSHVRSKKLEPEQASMPSIYVLCNFLSQ